MIAQKGSRSGRRQLFLQRALRRRRPLPLPAAVARDCRACGRVKAGVPGSQEI
jgi:hypothetical protein